jgi:hypothetical protein
LKISSDGVPSNIAHTDQTGSPPLTKKAGRGENPSTLWRWRRLNPAFLQACKQGAEAADRRVEASFYQRAVGYERVAAVQRWSIWPPNAVPTDGYVLSVDGKLKARYETANEAAAEGSKLKQSFPMIQVAVYDAAQRNYTPVELHEQEN